MKKKISCFLALCMSLACIGSSASYAAGSDATSGIQDGYVIQLGKEVEFNRIELMWNGEYEGGVSVTAGDTTLSGKADGETLNILSDTIGSDETDTKIQTFERETLKADSITVHSDTKPIVRLFKDEKISVDGNSVNVTNIDGKDKLFDGTVEQLGDRATFKSVDSSSTPPLSDISASLNDEYNISEFVLYTWGVDGWYPKSYTISAGGTNETVTTTDPTENGKYPNYNPYILNTPLNTVSDSFTVTFPEGGYSDINKAEAAANRGFRIYEIELYGSKAPVWTDENGSDKIKTYNFTSDKAGEAEKINITLEGANGTAYVKVNNDIIPVRLVNGIGSVAKPEDTSNGLTIGVMRIGDTYPGVELVKSAEVSTDNLSVADKGSRIVPTEYNADGNKNGQTVLSDNDSDQGHAAYYRKMFDRSDAVLPEGTQITINKATENEQTVDVTRDIYLGKRLVFYWDKYPSGYSDTKDYTDCSGWFTLALAESKNITSVELLLQNGSQSDKDKLFITDDISDYGREIDFEISSTTTQYAVDNKAKPDECEIDSMSVRTLTAVPNAKGKYIKAYFEGKSELVLIAEMIITVDETIEGYPETSALPLYEIDLGGEKTFNRIQLVWGEKQSGTVTVTAAEDVFEKEVNGTSLNLFTDNIDNSAQQQTFTREDMTAGSIVVRAESEPVVRLYNDTPINNADAENAKVSTEASSGLYNTDRLFDGVVDYGEDSSNKNNYVSNYNAITADGAVTAQSISGTLDSVYDISEFVLHTWGVDGWYPKSYTVSIGGGKNTVETDDPTASNKYPNANPYIIPTAVSTAADSFTVDFPNGGRSDAIKENPQNRYGFRIYEMAIYGSKSPIWSNDEFTTYTFTADKIKDAEKINIIGDSADTGVFVKINDNLILVPMNNGTGTIEIPSDASENGLSAAVTTINGVEPDIELVKSSVINDGITLADGGQRTVPSTYSSNTENGKATLDSDQYRRYEALFDSDGTTKEITKDEETAEYDFLGKKVIFYWNKYRDASDVPEDKINDYTDCSAYFTVDLGSARNITEVKLLVQNNSQSSNDKIYVSSNTSDYGEGYDVTIANTEKYAVDNSGFTADTSSIDTMDIRTMTAAPNKTGRYIKVYLEGIKSGSGNSVTIAEMLITADEVVANKSDAQQSEPAPETKETLTLTAQGGTITAAAKNLKSATASYNAILAIYNKTTGALVYTDIKENTAANTTALTFGNISLPQGEYTAILYRWNSLSDSFGMTPLTSPISANYSQPNN